MLSRETKTPFFHAAKINIKYGSEISRILTPLLMLNGFWALVSSWSCRFERELGSSYAHCCNCRYVELLTRIGLSQFRISYSEKEKTIIQPNMQKKQIYGSTHIDIAQSEKLDATEQKLEWWINCTANASSQRIDLVRNFYDLGLMQPVC